jgi:hypothetical protein
MTTQLKKTYVTQMTRQMATQMITRDDKTNNNDIRQPNDNSDENPDDKPK